LLSAFSPHNLFALIHSVLDLSSATRPRAALSPVGKRIHGLVRRQNCLNSVRTRTMGKGAGLA